MTLSKFILDLIEFIDHNLYDFVNYHNITKISFGGNIHH